MKQPKEQKKQQDGFKWNRMFLHEFDLKVLRLILELVNYDGTWQKRKQ